MSIPPDSPLRGCAASFPQPVENEAEVQRVMDLFYRWNRNETDQPLPNIVFRSGYGERDIIRHVFRWDSRDPWQIFESGFQVWPQGDTPDHIYYSLEHHVHHGGIPASTAPPDEPHFFVSTTVNSGYHPTLNEGEDVRMYRYEIYAPGGIWVSETLGERYRYPGQQEVSFVGGIAPQYIRSAQLFRGRREHGSRHPTWTRVDTVNHINGRFDPQSHPSRLLMIERPVHYYVNEEGIALPLRMHILRPMLEDNDDRREKRDVSVNAEEWYAHKVADAITNFVSSAFRACKTNEAYIFVSDVYVHVNYAPATTKDYIINGPLLICDGFPFLAGTTFGENGIDCAFDTDDGTKAFIFTSNLCAYIDYAPGTTKDKILKGPIAIAAMFPFFKGTAFENDIDSAFKATATNEAYLFKGNQYALINYSPDDAHCIAIRPITKGFYSLKGTIFESGIDAAFASHNSDEAYIFKGDQYALINFAPGTTDDYIIGSVKQVLPNWPSLRSLLLGRNRGIEFHDHHRQADDGGYDDGGHDEP